MLSNSRLKQFCQGADIGTASALGGSEGVSNRDPLHDADEFRVLGRIESIPAARQGFSSRRPLGGCERGGVWIIPTGRRKRIRTLFSRNTNSRRRDLTANFRKNEVLQEPQPGPGRRASNPANRKVGLFSLRDSAPRAWILEPGGLHCRVLFCDRAMTGVLKWGICPISRTANATPPPGPGCASIRGRGQCGRPAVKISRAWITSYVDVAPAAGRLFELIWD